VATYFIILQSRVLDVYSGLVQTGFRSFSKGLEGFNQLNASNAVLTIPMKLGR
jgi:hypothetical protein